MLLLSLNGLGCKTNENQTSPPQGFLGDFQKSSTCRCSTCAEFSARCSKATTEMERNKLESLQKSHLLNVHQYRLIQNRFNVLSETPGSNILKIDLDGLDQSKTKYPRNLASSKSLSACWRPQVHLVGIICWGVP